MLPQVVSKCYIFVLIFT